MPYPYPGRIANACVIFHFWDTNPYDQYDRYDFYKVYDGYGNNIATTVNYNDAWYSARYAMQRGSCSFIVNRDVDYDNDGSYCSVDVQSDPWGGISYRVTNRYGSVIADRIVSYQEAQRIAHTSGQCFQY